MYKHSLWLALLQPGIASAHDAPERHLHIGRLGVDMTLPDFSRNLIGLLTGSAVTLCTLLFLIGAFYLVISRGKQDQMQKGKDLMIGSLIGLGVIIASYAIVRTLFSIIY